MRISGGMVFVGSCLVILALSALAGVLEAAEKAAAGKARYTEDLAAFFAEMDKTYPFFDLKDIRKGWGPLKERLGKRVKSCSSDREFLGIVLEAIRYLRDFHMGIAETKVQLPPAEPEWYPGVSFLPATAGRAIVLGTAEKLAKALKPGTVVTQIDGKPARAYLEARAKEAWESGGPFSSPRRARMLEYRVALRGKKGQKYKISFLEGKKARSVTLVCDVEAKGWPHTYNMPEKLEWPGKTCAYGKLPSGVGYIYLRYIDGATEPGIAAALAACPDAKGWIIDLRGNGGGGYGESLLQKVAGLPQPVAVLIDAGCISAGETFARDLANLAKARIFGSATAGSSTAKRSWTFPSGIATLSIPTRSRMGINRVIEFFGIQPHEEVEAVPEEIAKGLNSEILRAEEYLLKSAGR